jgi:hypothetical protein
MATIPGPTSLSQVSWIPLQGSSQTLMQGYISMTYAMQIIARGTVLLLVTRNAENDQLTKAFWWLPGIKISVDTVTGLGTLVSGNPA